jgi:hypothetical protein
VPSKGRVCLKDNLKPLIDKEPIGRGKAAQAPTDGIMLLNDDTLQASLP